MKKTLIIRKIILIILTNRGLRKDETMSGKQASGYILSCIMIIIMVSGIYSNTIHSPWVFDDYHNIVNNPKIQINDLTVETIKGSFYSYAGAKTKLYRPVACFTLALNALAGGKNTFGYHIVNIGIHAAVSLALVWLFVLVFRTPALVNLPDKEKIFIIVLSAVLWAAHPIQTQAVTYIVQRMTSLCCFFGIISLGLFIKTRMAGSIKHKLLYSAGFLLSLMLSYFSKENGILIVPLTLCIEFFLFRHGDYRKIPLKGTIAVFCFTAAGFALLYLYLSGGSSLFDAYQNRPFTMYERVLTQPGILFYHLSQIFYPLPQRFSLEHEVVIHPGFFSSPQTAFIIILTVIIIGLCIFVRRIPVLLRLGVVFFYIAHSIESSIFPLELVFEHRNYLPSVFIFPPVAAGLYRICSYYSVNKKSMEILMYAFITVLIFMTGMSTYIRNIDWSSGERIWADAMQKAPGNARPKQSMGFVTGMKNPEKALYFYSQALKGYMHEPKEEKSSTLANIGFIYFHLKNFRKAQEYFKYAIEVNSMHMIARQGLILSYMNEGKWEKVLEVVNNTSESSIFNGIKASCFFYMGNYEKALELFRAVYRNRPHEDGNLINLAESLSMNGFYDRADFFYELYRSKNPTEPEIYLRMSKNCFLKKDTKKMADYLKRFFSLAGTEQTGYYIQKVKTNLMLPVAGFDIMQEIISSEFENYKNSINI